MLIIVCVYIYLYIRANARMLETLDHTIRIGSTPTFLYFDLYLYSAYAAHYVYCNFSVIYCCFRKDCELSKLFPSTKVNNEIKLQNASKRQIKTSYFYVINTSPYKIIAIDCTAIK